MPNLPVGAVQPVVDEGDRFAPLPKYYTHKDVIALVFDDNEEAFLDALCNGVLPPAVRAACEETLDPVRHHNALLRRLIRVNLQLLASQQALLDEIRRAPEVDRV